MEENNEGARSFARLVEMIGDGEVHAEASDKLHKLTRVLRETALERNTGVNGRITLHIDLNVDPKGIVEVEGSIAVKEPPSTKKRGILFITRGGNLTAEDPRQRKLPLREVSGRNDAPREAGAVAKEGK